MSDAEVIRAFVGRRLAELALEMKAVSLKIGKNHAYLHQYLNKRLPNALPADVAASLAPILGVNEAELIPPEVSPLQKDSLLDSKRIRRAQSSLPQRAFSVDLDGWPRDLPVYGTTRGGSGEGFELNTGDPIEHLMRPPGLIGVPKAFGLYVENDSMFPAFPAGGLVICRPGLPVIPHCYVVIEAKPKHEGDNPLCYLKRFLRRDNDKVFVEQLNPPKKMSFSTNEIKGMYRVLEPKELLGR